MPSGILRKNKLCVIGNGVVVDPVSLVEEIEGLRKLGVKVGDNLVVSETAHVVFPYHRELDAQREVLKGKNKIGTTKRGIGPAYGDKAARVGLRDDRLGQSRRGSRKSFPLRIKENNEVLKALGAKPLSFKKVFAEYSAAGEYLKPFVANTVVLLHEAMRRGDDILFEGAQGTFLDIDHGTYPFVTSSNTTAGGACTGSGVPPHRMDRVVGVMKAYTTRVGEGPLPTENAGDCRHAARRWAASSARRPAARAAAAGSIPSPRAMPRWSTALTTWPSRTWTASTRWRPSRSASAYRHGKTRYDFVPNDAQMLAECEPVYVEFEGWRTANEPGAHVEAIAGQNARLPEGHRRIEQREVVHRVRRPGARADDFCLTADGADERGFFVLNPSNSAFVLLRWDKPRNLRLNEFHSRFKG